MFDLKRGQLGLQCVEVVVGIHRAMVCAVFPVGKAGSGLCGRIE